MAEGKWFKLGAAAFLSLGVLAGCAEGDEPVEEEPVEDEVTEDETVEDENVELEEEAGTEEEEDGEVINEGEDEEEVIE